MPVQVSVLLDALLLVIIGGNFVAERLQYGSINHVATVFVPDRLASSKLLQTLRLEQS